MHYHDKTCEGDHTLIDPSGFGFEEVDAIGMRREAEILSIQPWRAQGRAARTSPKKVNMERDTKGRVRRNSGTLSLASPKETRRNSLAKTPQCQECMSKRIRYMSGRQVRATGPVDPGFGRCLASRTTALKN